MMITEQDMNTIDEQESYSDLDNPIAHLAHLPRPERRRQMRAEQKAKRQSLKHQVQQAEREGMPLETSADCLSDPTLHTTNTFRKECFRSRQVVYVPTATKKPGKPERKIAEMSFRQLGRAFRTSYAKRHKNIPNLFKRIRGTSEKAEKTRQMLSHAMFLHDQNIIRVNREIAKRVTPRAVVAEARLF